MIDVERPVILVLVLLTVLLGIGYIESSQPDRSGSERVIELPQNASEQVNQSEYRRARPISDPSGFINTDNVSIRRLLEADRVVLVDFWTYSCINCQRTFPYLNAWYEKYADDGLTIVGVHSPEFDFEKNRSNVKAAVETHGIEYPVVLDNDFATWANYDNRFWPQKYLIGINGFIRYEYIGEGSYAEVERSIQELLRERADRVGVEPSADLRSEPVDPGVEDPEYDRIDTSEIFFGSDQNSPILRNVAYGENGQQSLTIDDDQVVGKNEVYMGGSWFFTNEYAEAAGQGSTVKLGYDAKKVNMVAAAPFGATVSITVDGATPQSIAGEDVSPNGTVKVDEERLYNLVEHGEYGEHRLTITVIEGKIQLYTLTFG